MTTLRIRELPKAMPRDLGDLLKRYHRAKCLWRGVRAAALAIALALGFAVLACVFDRFVDVPGAYRAPLPWIAAIIAVGFIGLALFRLLTPANYDQLARELDAASEDTRGRLRSTLDFVARPALVAFFVDSTTEHAREHWRDRSIANFVERKPAMMASVAALFVIVVAMGLYVTPFMRGPLLLTRFMDPLGNYARPTATWFVVDQPEHAVYRSGDDMMITASLAGAPADEPVPLLRVTYPDGETLTRRLEHVPDGSFRAELKSLRRDFRAELVMGSVRSERFHATVLPRPTVTQVEVAYDFPKYARLEPKTEILKGRSIAALEGTRLRLTLQTNVDLSSARGVTEDDTLRMRVNRSSPREAIAHLMVKNQKMGVELVSADDVPSLHEAPFTFRAIADNPPSVSVPTKLDGRDYYVTDTIELAWRAQDDLGLASVLIKAESDEGYDQGYAGAGPVILDVDLAEFGAKSAEGTVRIPVSDLYSGQGKFLKLSMLARDMRDQEGESRVMTLKIASDSYDRQIRATLLTFDGDNSRDVGKRGITATAAHKARLAALRGARNEALILADSLEAGKPIAEDQKKIAARVRTRLDALAPPFYYGNHWFYDFQYAALQPRLRRIGEYAAVWSMLAFDHAALSDGFDKAVASPDPKAALAQWQAAVDSAITKQELVSARVAADEQHLQCELTGYLAAVTHRALTNASDEAFRDRQFVAQHRPVLDGIIRSLNGPLKRDDMEIPGKAGILEAAALPSHAEGLRAAAPHLATLAAWCSEQGRAYVTAHRADVAMSPRALLDATTDAAPFADTLSLAMYELGDNVGTDPTLALEAAARTIGAPANSTGGDAATRAKRETAYHAYDALGLMRSRLAEYRLMLAAGHLRADRPDAEVIWLDLRDARLALIAELPDITTHWPAAVPAIKSLIDAAALLDAYVPPADLAKPAQLDRLAHWEAACAAPMNTLAGPTRDHFAQLDRDVARLLPLMNGAIASYRKLVAEEIARLKSGGGGTGWAFTHVNLRKVRIMGLAMSAIAMLDAVDLARWHGIADDKLASDHGRLVALFAGFGRVVNFYEVKVETSAWQLQVNRQAQDPSGRVRTFEQLDERVVKLLPLIPADANQPRMTAEQLEPILTDLEAAHAWQSQLDAAAATRGIVSDDIPLAERLSGWMDDPEHAPAVWGPLHGELAAIRHLMADNSKAGELQQRAGRCFAFLNSVGPLPRDLQDLPDWLQRAAKPVGDGAKREMLVQLDAFLEAMAPLSKPIVPLSMPMMTGTDLYNFNLDKGALARAKWRSEQQIKHDRLMLRRCVVMHAIAGTESMPTAQVDTSWAVAEVEFNRRKAGVTLASVGLGAVAVGGDALGAINLPEHIYLELKRAREQAMPPLYRDRAHRFLNQVLEKARE